MILNLDAVLEKGALQNIKERGMQKHPKEYLASKIYILEKIVKKNL
jgi:hypothetical protein